jgi:ATPase family associated with various cellular activities (AAA)
MNMNEWLTNNNQYLETYLHWLRLKLTELSKPSNQKPEKKTECKVGWSFFPEKNQETGKPGNEESSVKKQIAELAKTLQTLENKTNPPPALAVLGEQFAQSRFKLSRFEQQILLLCAGMELDTRIADLCAKAQGNMNRPYPTFALAMALFDEPAWDAITAEGPLRYWRMLEINQPGAHPLMTSALRADERMVNFLKGLNTLDDRLSTLMDSVAPSTEQLPASQQQTVNSILAYLQQAAQRQTAPVIQLIGTATASKKLIAAHIAGQLHLQLYRLSLENLPTQAAELETFIRLWQREALLLPIAFYLDGYDLEPTAAVTKLLSHSPCLCFLEVREVWPKLDANTAVFDVANPTPVEQQALWQAELPELASQHSAQLAGQFNLDMASIRQIAQTSHTMEAKEADALQARVWSLCLKKARPQLSSLAQQLDVKATWEQIVLPKETDLLLHQIADQVRHRVHVYDTWGFREYMNRGLGISALFAGESGTGKTMAAEVIANDLRLDLYRVDLSAVISKYIGETEKNLRRLFDAAEDGSAILFFDEADAVFGKRSEVKDSHDRYANIEINYLLQRMEAFRGLAILATNLKSALDLAFVRRLRFIINFSFPGIPERKAMWQKVFPQQLKTEGLDYDRLARLNLTGGAIHNIALNAAFLAAARRQDSISMPVIMEAARTEYKKTDKPINEAEFRLIEAVGAS